MKNIFDFTRFANLTVRQLLIQLKTIAIAASAIVGLLISIGMLVVFFGNGPYSASGYLGLALPFFFIGGYVLSSIVFSELNNPHRGYLMLMLPATTLEKLLSAWVISSLLYAVFGAIVITGINLLLMAVSGAANANMVEQVNVLSPDMLKIFGIYMVTQSIFFLGAIYFRRAQFFKTVLTLFLFSTALALYTTALSIALIADDLKTVSGHNNIIHWSLSTSPTTATIGLILFWGLLAPFMLTVSYFRLKEREV